MKYFSHIRGVTLIELLLYVAVASGILLSITVLLSSLLEARVKNETMAEVEQQGMQALHTILQTARNAQNITTPTSGNTAGSLTLDVVSPGVDPTVFDLSSGVLQITEGAGAPVALTNTRVTVSGLSFSNLSYATTPGTIRATFTVTYTNTTGRQEYSFSKTFSGTASLRWP